jgi:hypothetical protein
MVLDAVRSAQNQLLPKERHKVLTSREILMKCGAFGALTNELKRPPTKTAQAPIPPAVPAAGQPTTVHSQAESGNVGAAAVVSPSKNAPVLAEVSLNPFVAAAQSLAKMLDDIRLENAELKEMNSLILEEVEGLRKRVETSEEHMRTLDKQERKVNGQERAKLPVVAILGCRKDEFDIIAKRTEERGLKVELRHYEQDTKPRPIAADYAISMKFISHMWDDHISVCVKRGNYTHLRGGMNQVVTQMEAWGLGGIDNT